jgi:probable phosphoglycerate mutase
MQLYFVRHGESEANVRQVFSNSDRDTAFGLTDVGQAQVEGLAGRLAGIPFAAFYCSPVLRARQSADIVSARLGIDYVVTPAIAEYDVGELEGKSDAASWQRYYAVRQAWFRDKEWTARIEGGESFEDIFDLVVEHGLGHTSVVIAEQRAHGLVCVQWRAPDSPGLFEPHRGGRG